MLWEISYANLNMLLATIPSYDFDTDKEKDKEKDVEVVEGIDDLKGFFKSITMAVSVKGGPLEFSASIGLSDFDSQLKKMENDIIASMVRQQKEQQRANEIQKDYANTVIKTGAAFKNLDSNIQNQLKSLSSLQNQLQKVKDAQAILSERKASGLIGDDTFNSSMGALIAREKELSQAVAKTSQEMQTADAIMRAADGSIVQKTLHLENLKRQYSELSQVDRNTASIGGNLLGNIQQLDAELRVINNGFQQVQQNAVGSINAKSESLAKLKSDYAALAETDRNSNIGARMLSNIHALDEELRVINASFQAVQKNASGSLNEKLAILTRLKNEYAALSEVDRKGSAGKELAKNIKGLDKEVQKINSELTTTESVLKRTAAAVAAYATLTTAGNFISDVVRVRGEFQQLEVAFTTMLGSKEKADKLMAEVTRFAATTPFELKEVAGATRSLLAFGIGAEKIKDTLRALGDVSAGVGAPIEEIAQIYGRARVQGRLFAEDINQLTGRGIPIIQELAKQFKVNEDQVKGLVEAGKVGFPQIEQAFKDLTAAGSAFGGLMEAQSKTLTGQLSNLSDAWSRMLNDIGRSNEGIFSGAIAGAISLVENYETVLDILKVLVLTYGSYRASIIATAAIQAIQTAATSGYTIAETLRFQAMLLSERAMKLLNATMLSNPAVAVATGIAALVAAFVIFRKETNNVKTSTELLNAAQKKAADSYSEQEAKLRPFLEVLKAGNTTEEQRLDIYKKIQAINPDIVKGLDAKSLSYENLKRNVDAYLTSLRNQLAVEANQEAITASIKEEQRIEKIIAAQKKRIESLKSLNTQLRGVSGGSSLGVGSGSDQTTNINIAQSQLKATEAELKAQKKVTDELAKQGATQTQSSVEQQAAHRRTVEVIEDEIKALKDQRTKVSETSAQYKQFTGQITKLEKELEAITGKDAAKTALKDAKDRVKELQDLLNDIAKAEEGARRSGLTKEETEIDKINARYDELKKRAQEVKASEGVLQRIENARSEETGNERQQDQFNEYKKFISDQQAIFTQFEDYKQDYGEQKARELTDFQTAEYQDAIEFLKIQLSLLNNDFSFAGKLKKEFLVNAIASTEKDKVKRDTERQVQEFKKVADATVTFNIKRKQLEEQYQKDVDTLRKRFTGDELAERESALKKSHEQELEDLDNNAERQKRVFQLLNQDIVRFTRQQVKDRIKELRKILDAEKGLTPEIKSSIIGTISNLQNLLKSTSGDQMLADDLKKAAEWAGVLYNSLSSVANSVRGVNDELATTLDDLASVTKIAEAGLTAAVGALTGDVQAAVSGTVQYYTQIFDFVFAAPKRSRIEAERELAAFTQQLTAAEQEINLIYRERAREQVKLNKLKQQGLQDEKKLLEEQKKLNEQQYQNVLKQLQQQEAIIGKSTSKSGGIFGIGAKTKITDITESLAGRSFDELEKLFISGQLEGKAKELFEQLQKIKQEGVDIDRLLAENAEAAKQAFTGTTADSITDSIIDGFQNGLSSARDFADTFEQLMKKAVLQSLKMQALEGPLKDFFDEFAKAAESDTMLTDSEIQTLQNNFNNIINDAGKKFAELQKITNMDFSGDGSSGSAKSLTGAIRGMTEQQAELLAGQFGGLRLTALDHLKVASSSLTALQAIQNHTSRLIRMDENLQWFRQYGIELKK